LGSYAKEVFHNWSGQNGFFFISQVAELVDAARYGNTEGDGISPISVK